MNFQDFYNEYKNKLGVILLFVLVAGFMVVTDRRVSDVQSDVVEMYSPLRPYLPVETQAKIDALLTRWDELEPTVLSIEEWVDEQGEDTAMVYGYQTLVHGDGPNTLVVEDGGELEVKSGGILDAQTGSVVGFDDVIMAGDLTVGGTAVFNITSPTLTQDLNLTGTLTAEDIVVTDTIDINGDLDLDGDGFDVNITAGFSIDADAASNINVAGAGEDLTFESEDGRLVLKGDEALADAVFIDADDAAGTGLTINVGASGGVLISGGPTDIGGGTCGTATGDNDLCVADALEVDGATDLDGTLIVDGATSLNHVSIDDWLTLDPATAISVTAGMVITPVSSLQPLTSGSAVTCDTTVCLVVAGFTAGDILILRNDNASDTVTIDGTGGTVECKSDVVLGAADTLTLLFDGSVWNCIAYYDNS